jgi:hypothetical protein
MALRHQFSWKRDFELIESLTSSSLRRLLDNSYFSSPNPSIILFESLPSEGTPRIRIMPTPESEAFLAKKPKVPPTFDGVDYDDTPRLKQAQDAIIREQWVKSMMARLVREELGKCYYREGVNHLEKCGALRGKLPKSLGMGESRHCGCSFQRCTLDTVD